MNDADHLESALQQIRAEGVVELREQLLLWLMRTRFGVSAEDSYASVFIPSRLLLDSAELDGLVVVEGREISSAIYFLFDLNSDSLVTRAAALATVLAVKNPEYEFAKKGRLIRLILDRVNRSNATDLSRVVVCVTSDTLTKAKRAAIRKSISSSTTDAEIYDMPLLQSLADAERSNRVGIPKVRITIPTAGLLNLMSSGANAVVLPVRTTEIARWEGVEDRSLFDLNVRHALGLNKVRRSLDLALTDPTESEGFIAYHNGITAVCSDFSCSPEMLDVTGFSVVNGAQTVVAIQANRDHLSTNNWVLLKLVKAAPDSVLAMNIAIRSNTQNPVTSRNFRALDPIQERLRKDLVRYGFNYVTRPDSQGLSGEAVIKNDDVAQLLCSIYARKPALAVKRQVLFEDPHYREVFPEGMTAGRVVLAHLLREVIEEFKPEVDEEYQKAWALPRLTLVYMSAEAMRADRKLLRVLEEPDHVATSRADLKESLRPFVRAAVQVLNNRHAEFVTNNESGVPDDFRIALKQTSTVTELGVRTAKYWTETKQESQ